MKHGRAKVIGLIAALVLGSYWLTARLTRPPLWKGKGLSQAVYDRDGDLLRLTLASDETYRLWLPLSQISHTIVEATLLHEDKHFFTHPGINPTAIGRAFWQTYVMRGRRIGGSTLTMQLARMLEDGESRSIGGKLKQIVGALRLELLYSKREILEAYLNLVPYGGNVEGIGAASLIYFRTDASRLTLPEALTLAVIPQSPTKRSLKSAPARESLQAARTQLYAKWKEEHPASDRFDAEMRMPISTYRVADLPFLAPHLAEALLKKDSDSFAIHSTLDLKLQKLVERQTKNYLLANKAAGFKNAVVMILDHSTMEVRALQGSADYFDSTIQGQVNGTQAKRSPGSALKPFVYGLAIDQGLIHPQTMLKDTPASFGGFDPENFDRDFQGPLSATEALIRSRNVPAVALASRLKAPSFYELLKTAGITRLRDEKFYGLSIVLGGAEVTMEEMLRLYASIPEGGRMRPLRFREGDPEVPESKALPLLSPEAAYVTLSMLHKNPRPQQRFHRDWTRDQISVAWKTGTSHGFRDAWSVGIFGNYVIGVWIGNFDGQGNMNFVGRDAAGPLLFDIADAIRISDRHFKANPLLNTPRVTQINVCPVSGDLPGPFCKARVKTLFIPGKSPIHTCEIHRAVEIDPRTGKRLCHPGTKSAKKEIYEFWPSDLLKLFLQAGIPRRTPPPYEKGCSLQDAAQQGTSPEITSPKRELSYALRSPSSGKETVPLTAVTDADARELYWFSNEEFLGKSPRDQALFWKPKPGRYLIRVVDDHGRSDAREVSVSQVE